MEVVWLLLKHFTRAFMKTKFLSQDQFLKEWNKPIWLAVTSYTRIFVAVVTQDFFIPWKTILHSFPICLLAQNYKSVLSLYKVTFSNFSILEIETENVSLDSPPPPRTLRPPQSRALSHEEQVSSSYGFLVPSQGRKRRASSLTPPRRECSTMPKLSMFLLGKTKKAERSQNIWSILMVGTEVGIDEQQRIMSVTPMKIGDYGGNWPKRL